MKLKVFVIIFLNCIIFNVDSQNIVDLSADRGLMVRQISNTEEKAKKYFAELPIVSDTIYAIIFRPANCPRCDGFINRIDELIKKCTSKPSVLISVYPDSVAARAYVDKYALNSDYYMFDTDERFAEIFSFSPGYLHVGYILKMNKTTGELIVGSNADNVTIEFFDCLNLYNVRKETMEFPCDKAEYIDWESTETAMLVNQDCYKVHVPESTYSISEIIYQPVFQRDNLLWNDKLAMGVVEFELHDSVMQYKRIVEPDSTEFSKFVNLPSQYYKQLLKANQLKNIPLQPFIIDDDKYGIAYSMPELWLDGENELNYRNKPCYLVRSISDLDYSDIVPLEYDFEDIFYYPHFNMKGVGDDKVVVGVERITWPMVTNKSEYADSPADNPFQNEFYESYEQPTLAIYNKKDGLLNMRFGELPGFAKKTKTGYCYSDMVFDCWEGEAVYGQSFEGNLIISSIEALDCLDCQKKYEVFGLDENMFKEPEPSDYYSYNCNALALPFLNRKVMDVMCDYESIHCIVRHCTDAFERPEYEDYDYVVINRKSGQRKTFKFPQKSIGERRISYGLRRLGNGDVMPYYIAKSDNTWKVQMASPE